METTHLFFHCQTSQEVWEKVPWSSTFTISTCISFADELSSSLRRVNLSPSGITTNLFPWVCWAIWGSRTLLLALIFSAGHYRQRRNGNRPNRSPPIYNPPMLPVLQSPTILLISPLILFSATRMGPGKLKRCTHDRDGCFWTPLQLR